MIEKILYKELKAVYKDVYAVHGTRVPCVTYNISPLTAGIVRQSSLEVRVIHSDYDKGLEIKESIIKLLDMKPSAPTKNKDGMTYRVLLSGAGGGVLFNEELKAYEHTLFFIIKHWKE